MPAIRIGRKIDEGFKKKRCPNKKCRYVFRKFELGVEKIDEADPSRKTYCCPKCGTPVYKRRKL